MRTVLSWSLQDEPNFDVDEILKLDVTGFPYKNISLIYASLFILGNIRFLSAFCYNFLVQEAGIHYLLSIPIYYIPDSKIHGANMGPTWGRQDPGGPHVGPMNLAIWDSQ